MKRERATAIAGVSVMLVAGVVTGLGLAAALLIPTTPESLERSSELATIPVTLQDYADPQPVRLFARVGPPVDVVVQRAGTVTKSNCAEGRALESGASSVAIDGENILTLTSDVPLWRDLTVGDEGPDVRALEKELKRLGRSVESNATLSSQELDELSEVGRKAHVAIEDRIDRSRILWLADPEVVISSCEKQLGEAVAPGDVFARGESNVALSAVTLPEGRLPGARMLDLLDEPTPLNENGRLPDTVDSDAVRQSSAYQVASSNAPGASELELSTTASLVDPVKVAAVPATAVLIDDAGDTCVFSRGAAVGVRVVGSEFGNTFITFTGDGPPTEIDVRPRTEGPGCG